MSFLSELKEEMNRVSSNLSNLFYLKTEQEARVRFLTSEEWGVKMLVHSRWVDAETDEDRRYTTPCYKEYGFADCPYCGLDDRTTGAKDGRYSDYNFGWLVWNYGEKPGDGKPQVLIYKARGINPLNQIAKSAATYGTILGRDFVISLEGKDNKKKFAVVGLDKSDFKITSAPRPKSKEDAIALMKKMCAEAWNPELLQKPEMKKPEFNGTAGDVESMLEEQLEA